MKKIFFGLLFSVISTNAFATGVVCGSSFQNLGEAIGNLNKNLQNSIGWEISRPVFHETTSSTGAKSFYACVSWSYK